MQLKLDFEELAAEDPVHVYEPRLGTSPKKKKKQKTTTTPETEVEEKVVWYFKGYVSDVVMRRMHNHIGKMLPEIPDMDTQLALSAKMIDKRQATPKVSTSLFFREEKILSRCSGTYFVLI